MSYIHSKVELERIRHGGNAYILEPDDEDIHPSHEWAKYPADQNVDLDSHKIENLANPSASTDAVNKTFLESNYYDKSTADSNYLQTDGTNAMSANLDVGSNKVTNVVDPTNAQEGATKNYIDTNYYDQSTSDNRYVRTDGANAMSANLDMGTNKITSVVDPTSAQEASTKNYVDSNYYDQSTSDSRYVRTDGANAMSANLDMGTNKITSVVDPTANQEVATKNYVDSNVASFGKLYTADQESFNVSVPANDFKLVTHTVGTFDNVGTHYIQAFIIFWGANSSPPNNTSIAMQISDGSKTFHHPIQSFSTTYQPSLPNIPQDHPDTLYMRYSNSFDSTDSIDVSLEINNNDGNSQDYNIYFFEHVIEGKSSTDLP